ncbi:hypothetical protein [Rappaport israeli]|uniref:hypothetical protein n=1 Tax=Rappaport israeli TaxID=1839807 RepID=UPI000931C86A|nr:hypothetical protein [Rappaport israeli]
MNTLQSAAAAAALSVDLATVSTDRLIELCLLYRAAPDALVTFPAALQAEIERRFTREEIAQEDVMFSVLQHFSNQFKSPIPYAHQQFMNLLAQTNRHVWFVDNRDFYRTAINNPTIAQWLLTRLDILTVCINDPDIGLSEIADSEVMTTAIVTHTDAYTIWQEARDLWRIWPQHSVGMTVIAKSEQIMTWVSSSATAMQAVAASATAMQAVAASDTAMQAVAASDTAMQAVAASDTAMQAVIASDTAMQAVAASDTAMQAVIASDTAMQAVAGSGEALASIINTAAARNKLIAHNSRLQAYKTQIFNTVKATWTRKKTYKTKANYQVDAASGVVRAPAGLVFAVLGGHSSRYPANTTMRHPNGAIVAVNNRHLGDDTNSITNNLDGVSFNGAQFNATAHYGRLYIELWAPQ